MMRETLSSPPVPGKRRGFASSVGLVMLAWALLLAGCTTLQPKTAAVRPAATAPAAKPLALERLRSGMSIAEVKKLEPPPTKVVTMRSQAMTVVKWIYESGGHTAELYFTNGFLSSWQE